MELVQKDLLPTLINNLLGVLVFRPFAVTREERRMRGEKLANM